MPFEVTPIEETASSAGSPTKTAEAIKKVYSDVSKRGGEIIAGHTITVVHPEDPQNARPGMLFLVAEIPTGK